jgi:hypothetical protein
MESTHYLYRCVKGLAARYSSHSSKIRSLVIGAYTTTCGSYNTTPYLRKEFSYAPFGLGPGTSMPTAYVGHKFHWTPSFININDPCTYVYVSFAPYSCLLREMDL